MSSAQMLMQRCDSKCELCSSGENLLVYEVAPVGDSSSIMVCGVCHDQISNHDNIDVTHWHCLNSSMWSEVPAVKVMAWRMLKQLSSEGWAQDLFEMLYLDDETLQWAESVTGSSDDDSAPILDSNDTVLQVGDSVTLIKDLDVKGADFTAKRGTTVRNISLTGNPDQIEGRVNGVRIVLLTKFLKKSN